MKVLSILFSVILVFTGVAEAKLSYEEVKQALQKNEDLRCELTETILTQTKTGFSAKNPNKEDGTRYIFKDLKPEASSTVPGATHSIEFSNDQYRFYYYMNTQVGEILIDDKELGIQAVSDLNIMDMVSGERKLGAVQLRRVEDVKVQDPETEDTSKLVPGETYTILTGECWFQ